ncbi:hypothetical protein QBC45DRAFT_449940 [Copromyces sp. CBS 386.78]|nr:hypothetical protein QBC45DRAFT_449940 [Copromyces sp. CBS 386.78]
MRGFTVPPSLCPRLQDLLGCIILGVRSWERMQSNALRINSLQISSLLVRRAWCAAGECWQLCFAASGLVAFWWIAIHDVETAHNLPHVARASGISRLATASQKSCAHLGLPRSGKAVILKSPIFVHGRQSVYHNDAAAAAAASAAPGSYADLGENNTWGDGKSQRHD